MGVLSEQLHSFDYITYASLQMAKDAEAREIVREAAAIAPRADNLAEAYALAAIPARFAVERNRGDEARALAVRSSPYAQSRAIPQECAEPVPLLRRRRPGGRARRRPGTSTNSSREAGRTLPGGGDGARGTDGSAGRSGSTVSRGDRRTEAQR